MPWSSARRAWVARQRLGAYDDPSIVPGGWIQAIGGATAYLALRARNPGIRRETIDALVANDHVVATPGVRGCIWLAPREDATLALVVGHRATSRRQAADRDAAGISQTEIDVLSEQVVAALTPGPLPPDALRRALPDGAARSLGEVGKARGLNTPLPAVLRHLEALGTVRRTLPGGRLDTQEYQWALAPSDWLDLGTLPADEPAQYAALVERYLTWAGPSRGDELAAWSQLDAEVLRRALSDLGATELMVEGDTEPSYSLPGQLQMTVIDDDDVHLLPALDNLFSLRAHPGRLVDKAHHDLLVPTGTQDEALGTITSLSVRPMVFRGALFGFWAWDAIASQVVWGTLSKVDAAMRMAIEEAAGDLAPFLRDDLHGATHMDAVDGDDRRNRRVGFVRSLQH